MSALLLVFSAVVTSLVAYFHWLGYDEWSYWDVVLLLILAVFLFQGRRWAMIVSMLYWTFNKADTIYDALNNQSPNGGTLFTALMFWAVYMHVFYLAYRTEQTRPIVASKVDPPRVTS